MYQSDELWYKGPTEYSSLLVNIAHFGGHTYKQGSLTFMPAYIWCIEYTKTLVPILRWLKSCQLRLSYSTVGNRDLLCNIIEDRGNDQNYIQHKYMLLTG